MAVGKPGVPSWVDTAGDHAQRRSSAADDTIGITDQEWTAGRIGGSSRAQAALSRLLALGLWGGIGLALVVSLVNCAGNPAATLAPGSDPTPAVPVPPPGGCAELVVAAWLAGDTDQLAEVPGVPRSQTQPDRRRATHTYTASVTPGASVTRGQGAWGYLIGAEVQVRDEEERWQPAGTQFFTVTMVPAAAADRGCQGWRPAALPAQATAPSLAGEPPARYEVSLPHSGTELAATLEAFFAGLLTGAEGLDRYVSPGITIRPVLPPPYQQVSLTDLGGRDDPTDRGTVMPPDGTVVQLLATVSTSDEDLPLVYPVTAGVRGGRWEVVAIDPLVGTTVAGPLATPAPTTPTGSTNGG